MTTTEPVRTDALVMPAQPVTGAVLGGRYRLLERIGRGGMADVFAAEDALLTRRVAVKIFRFDLSTDDELRRVHAEMQTLAALHHPGLVTVFDAGTVHEAGAADQLASPYLVMELVNGPNLGQRLAEGPLSRAETAQLGTELAATLAYVHARDVIHRDVKPANILLDSTIADRAPFASKLTDFGIARVVDSTHYTEAGFTVGTANYLSPEQTLSAEVGTATDVYSLGLVLLECLTGELAYPGSGVEAALARLNRQPAIPAGLAPDWQQLLAAATEREPANRPSAAELGAELRRLAAADDPTGIGPIGSWSVLGAGAGGVGSAASGSATGGSAGRGIPTGRPTGSGIATGGLAATGLAAADLAAAGRPSGGFRAAAPAAAVPAAALAVIDRPPVDHPWADDEAVTEAVRLAPAEQAGHRRGGVFAAAALVLAALLTSGFLLRAGADGGKPSPGTPVNFSSTAAAASSTHASAARTTAASAAPSASASSVIARVQAPMSTAVVTRTVIRSSAPTSASSAASPSATASSSSAPPSSSASATASSSSAPPSSSASATASAGNGKGHGKGK